MEETIEDVLKEIQDRTCMPLMSALGPVFADELIRFHRRLVAAIARKDSHTSEMGIRKILWLRHNCGGGILELYGDDGEMQCNKCMIDFKRDTPQAIESRFIQINLEGLDSR